MKSPLKRATRHLLLAAVIAAVPLSAFGADNIYYRHRDSNGVTVIEKYVSPEAVQHGYEEINGATGEVIKKVPGKLSASERARQKAEQAEQQQREQQRKRDESLMLRYSSVDDIRQAKKRALHELDLRINILRSNLKSVKGQIEAQQARAADIERRGGKVPSELVDNIAQLKDEIEHSENRISQRQRERTQAAASYDSDIKRFEQLMKKRNSSGQAQQDNG